MSYRIGILDWLIQATTKGFDSDIKNSEKTVKSFGDKLTSIGKFLKTGAIVTGLVAVGKKAFAMGEILVDAASTAQETENKFNVVFANVADEAEAAGDRIKDEFKLSDQSTEAFLSQVGDITTGLGATSDEALRAAEQITTLGLDIDSFANLAGGAEQAVSALTSLFTGEREAAKALGIVINETNLKQYAEDTGKVYSELTQLEKGFLSLELAESQSELAIGDFARSIDSYANQSRIAEAATDDLKAAMGERLLPAATGLKSVYAGLTREIADSVTEMNKLRALLKDLEDGSQDEARSLEELKSALSLLEEKAKNGSSARVRYNDEIEALKLLIDQYGIKETFDAKEKGALQTEEARAEAIRKAAEEEEKRLKILGESTEAIDLLEQRRIDSLSTDEIQLEYLQDQIDYWAEFRNTVPGAQQLLNDLVKERNGLLEEETELEETSIDITQTRTEVDAMFRDAVSAANQRQLEETEANNQAIMDQNQLYIDLSEVGLNALLSGFEAIGTALQDGTLGWDDFGKAGLLAVSAILQALGAQLAAMAALAAVQSITGLNVGASLGVVPASLGSAAAYTAAGFVSSLAGSFEQGGTVPEISGISATGDKTLVAVNGGETITPKDESNGDNHYTFEIDGDIIADMIVNKRINKGRFSIDSSRGLK